MTNNQTKWTPEEDKLLRQGVHLHGIRWQKVKGYMKHIRSINSIIKRWHNRVKYDKESQNIQEPHQQPKPQLERPEAHDPPNEPEETAQKGTKKAWTERDDKKLKLLAVDQGVLDWETLAKAVQADVDQTKIRWKSVVYPHLIREDTKNVACAKWTVLEDRLLCAGQKQGMDWEDEGRIWLPSRSLGSIETRWRRISKVYDIKETNWDRRSALKECLRRIAKKQRLQLEQGTN